MHEIDKEELGEDGLDREWRRLLRNEFNKEYFIRIRQRLLGTEYLPAEGNLYEFTKYTRPNEIRVVIVGQDPYQRSEEATGMAFSAPVGNRRIPSSLKTIYRAIQRDYPNYEAPKCGNLKRWAEQGVLLLNDTLTVEEGCPGSHIGIGWSIFTDEIVRRICDLNECVVFLLCGVQARSKANIIDKRKHHVIETVHPSHYTAVKFIESQNFLKINEFLRRRKQAEIIW
ncbi:UNG [Enterospora canceri]|uniref:Uracil-DNA glycosylase n=1 Tax=Enterospora canceri TaxID=1081671 RepID=A0A1Y1S684_9MICR|nr:UNG [Enterospora canceri]